MQMQYTLSTEYRDSGNWIETGDPSEQFDDLTAARAAAKSAEGNSAEDTEGEYRAVVTDQDGHVVYKHEWKIDPAQDAFDAANWIVKIEGEFRTEYYGISDSGEYLHTIQNGGSRGAHSRQEGDGRWSTMADPIETISLGDLLKAIIQHDGGNVLDAASRVADDHPSKSTDDILIDIASDWEWTDTDRETVMDWLDLEGPRNADAIRSAIVAPDDAKADIGNHCWESQATYLADCNGSLVMVSVDVARSDLDHRWYIRTSDDAGGGDDCDDTPYATKEKAVAAAEAYAEANDETPSLDAMLARIAALPFWARPMSSDDVREVVDHIRNAPEGLVWITDQGGHQWTTDSTYRLEYDGNYTNVGIPYGGFDTPEQAAQAMEDAMTAIPDEDEEA